MLSRTPGNFSVATGRAMRAPLAAVDANINNVNANDADPNSSTRTPFKSKRIDKNTNSTTKKKKKKKYIMETRTGEVVSSITKKRRRTKSMTKTRRDINCENCTTSSPAFIDDSSVPMHFKPFQYTNTDPKDETHLHSLTIPINESFHIYESDGEATFESCADEWMEAKTKIYQSSTISTKPLTTTYSAQQWEDKQCSTFASWLNKLFYPEDDDSIHTISDEEMSAEWNSAKELFESSDMHSIRNAVEREVKEGRLAIVPPRTDRFVLDEVYVQEQLTKLLLSYTPRWLQLGLGIVLGSSNGGHDIQIKQCMTKESLKKIIKERVLTEPTAVQKYTGGKCKTPSGRFESNLRITIHQHALSQIMTLIFFLDKAKTNGVLSDDPCLFERASTMKSSEKMLLSLCQDCFLKQGSIIKHLDFEGISVSHVQTPLEEYDFHVKNLAVDLKDGVRLARMIDAITSYRSSDLLSSMRLPATTRQHRMYNVNLALSALRHLGVPHISDITTAHIVTAHQPRILQLIWSIILYYDLPQFENEINEYKASRLIQGYARRFLGMRSYRLAYHGVILFQSLYRGVFVRTAAKKMRDATLLIQRVWRGYHAKRLYEVKLRSVVIIQRFCRQEIARRVEASIAIQRIWRGYTCTIDFVCSLLDIIKIQSLARRFISKKRTNEILQMKVASTEIQRIWRGYHKRMNYGFDLMDIIIVQSVCRRFIATIRIKDQSKAMANAAIAIQRVWRGHNAMTFYGFQLLDIIMVQSVCRRYMANKISIKSRSSRKIQSAVRMWMATKKYSTSRRAICTIQSHFRRFIASSHARSIKMTITDLQSFCRGWLCRKQFPMKESQDLFYNEESITLSHVRQAIFNRTHEEVEKDVYPDKTSFGASDALQPYINCSSSDDDEEIYFTSRHATGKQLSSVAKLHDIHVDESAFFNPEQPAVSERKPLESSTNVNCPLSGDGKEIYATSRYPTKKQLFNEAKIIDQSSSFNPNQPGDDASSLHNLNCPSSVDDEEIFFTSRHATKKQLFSVAKIAESSPKVRRDIQINESASCKQEGDDAIDPERKKLQSPANVLSSSSDDGNEIYFTDRHSPKQQCFLKTKIHEFRNSSTKAFDTKPVYAALKVSPFGPKVNFDDNLSPESLRGELAATVIIQAAWRRSIAIRTLLRKLEAKRLATSGSEVAEKGVLNNFPRPLSKLFLADACLSISALQLWKQEVASVLIQSMWRRIIASNNFLRLKKAAIVCQCCFQKRAARRKLLHMRLQAAKDELHRKILFSAAIMQRSQSFAVIQIQRVWRGYKANVNHILIVLAAIKIQSFARRTKAAAIYNGVKAKLNASITIQAVARGMLIRLRRKRIFSAVAILQRAARVMLTRKLEHFAATEIQRVWRGYVRNLNFFIFVISAMKIQALFRCRQARNKMNALRAHSFAEVKCFATTEIQRCWRGFRSRIKFTRAVVSVVRIQSAIRGWQAKQNLFIRQRSRLVIQSSGRCFLAKHRARRVITAMETHLDIIRKETEWSAATTIQRMWRGYQANVYFMLSVMSAIKIQSFMRFILAKINDSRPLKEVAAENMSIVQVVTGHQLQEPIDPSPGNEIESVLFSRENTFPLNISIPTSTKLCRSLSLSSAVEVQSNETPMKLIVSVRSPKFGRRTTNAIRTILVSKNFNEIFKAAAIMAEITQQSSNNCQLLISKGIDQRLISILRRCNRSSPHMELVRIILTVLTNLGQHPKILSKMAKENSVDALTDTIQMFRDKSTIFVLTSSLLEKMLLVNACLVSKYSTPETKKRLRGIILICQKRMAEVDDIQKGMNCLENVVRLVNASSSTSGCAKTNHRSNHVIAKS